jgi:hypothetical protein
LVAQAVSPASRDFFTASKQAVSGLFQQPARPLPYKLSRHCFNVPLIVAGNATRKHFSREVFAAD